MDWWTRALLPAFSTASLCRSVSANTNQDWGGNALAWVITSDHDLSRDEEPNSCRGQYKLGYFCAA